MKKKQLNLEVDQLLDLYLLAGKLNDQDWQQEIIEKLKNQGKTNHETEGDHSMKIHNLWLEYKNLNAQILDLYNRLKDNTTDEDIFGKINALKEKRLSLTHKIHKEERKMKHSYQ
ncbi:hypothetical protein [Niallia sp. Krafla_26]|uniref:hypothetical protein n=1 Tax=Niallia sp. Krafla_26 TaxID=3064703 RepID=UPI003D18163C